MINLSVAEPEIVKNILKEHVPNCEVRVFGSRVNGSTKPYSDLDLVLVADDKIDNQQMSNLQEAFVESELSFRVDLLDWARISTEFRAVIEKKFEVIQA